MTIDTNALKNIWCNYCQAICDWHTTSSDEARREYDVQARVIWYCYCDACRMIGAPIHETAATLKAICRAEAKYGKPLTPRL